MRSLSSHFSLALRDQRSRFKLVVTGIALLGLLAVVAVATMNATATPRSVAEVRVQGWVNELKDDQLTTARQEAQRNLEAAGETAVPPLLVALRSDNVSMRRNAADMLGYIASPQATDALRGILFSDPVPAVRRNAAWALGEIKDSRAINDLYESSIADKSEMVRGAAADSLARIRSVLAKNAGVNEQLVGAYAAAPQPANLVLIAAKRDLYVSEDGGATWHVLSSVLPSQLSALAINPQNDKQMYAGVEGMGMYTSQDGGNTWTTLNAGLTTNPGAREVISAIAIDPENPDVIYAARGVWLGTGKVDFYPVGLMVSRDGGRSWQALNAGSGSDSIAKLAFRDGQLYGLAGNRVLTLVTPQ